MVLRPEAAAASTCERNSESQVPTETYVVIICIFLRLAGDSYAHENLRSPDVAYTAYPATGTWRKGEGEGTHMSTLQIEEGRTELWVLTW